MEAVRIVAAIAGALLVLVALAEAIRTFVVPRGLPLRLSRPVMRGIFTGMSRLARRLDEQRAHELMVYAAPLAVLALPVVWLLASLLGYAGVIWAIDANGFGDAVVVSGSSLLTLGFDRPEGVGGALAAFSEAAVGLGLVAVVISYLPSLNAGFQRRESVIATLDARAGVPPSAMTMLERHFRWSNIEHFDQSWSTWETWIVDVGQTHTTLPMLALFRSGDPTRSWTSGIGALLDAANFRLSSLQASGPGNASAWFFYRAATSVLARLAAFFRLPLPPAPPLARAEFDAALDHLAQFGVPLREDRDQAFASFGERWAEYAPVVSVLGWLVDAPPRPSPLTVSDEPRRS